MKGIVFTEFLEMVEDRYGLETVDTILKKADLPSNGAYTAVGTYDFFEMHSLLFNLSEQLDLSVDELMYTFGLYFFSVLTGKHSNIFAMYQSPIDMITSIENHIHMQVRKIYPDAELPTFKIQKKSLDYVEMMYFSERSMSMFAKALIEKTFEYYHSGCEVQLEKLSSDGSKVCFKILTPKNAVIQN